MRRIILALVMVLALSLPAVGADYYVNSETGSNANNGTSAETPWKDASFADDMIEAGDTLTIVAPATAPLRNVINPENAGASGNVITIKGSSESQKAHILNSRDVSHGATIGNLFFHSNPDFEAWKTTTDPWAIYSEGDTLPTRSTKAGCGGTYCASMVDSGANAGVYFYAYLPELTAVTLTWDTNCDTDGAGYRFRVPIQCTNTGNYLADDGVTWQGAGTTPERGTNYYNTWGTSTLSFTTDEHTNGRPQRYKIWFLWSEGVEENAWLDDVSLTIDAATYSWSVSSGDVYILDNEISSDDVEVLAKCTDAEWSASGAAALEYVHDAALDSQTQADMDAGEWYYDQANNDLYYRLESGEAIGDIHFEAGDGNVGLVEASSTPLGAAVLVDTEYITLQDLWFGLNNRHNVEITAANSNLVGVESFLAKISGIIFDEVGGTGTQLIASYCDDGISVNDGTVTLTRCYVHHNQDDGIQIYGTTGNGEATVAYSVAAYNGQSPRGEGLGSNYGFVTEQTGSVGYFYNNTSYGNGGGFIAGEDCDTTIYNCIAYGNTVWDVYEHSGATSNTHDYNVYGVDTASWSANTNEQDETNPNLNILTWNPGLSSLFSAGTNISGFHDTANGQEDFDGTQVTPYQIPIGGQGYERPAAGIVSNAGIFKNGDVGN
jgi:hypothetical protein